MVVTGSSRQRGGDASVESAREVLPGDVQERERVVDAGAPHACGARVPRATGRERQRVWTSLSEREHAVSLWVGARHGCRVCRCRACVWLCVLG